MLLIYSLAVYKNSLWCTCRLESATLVEIPEGLGGSSVPDKNGKTQGGWGSEISSVVGVWIFSGTT